MKYPDVHVQLVGEDGNSFSILARTMKALRRHGVPRPEIDQFMREATAGDYENLLNVVMDWVDVS